MKNLLMMFDGNKSCTDLRFGQLDTFEIRVSNYKQTVGQKCRDRNPCLRRRVLVQSPLQPSCIFALKVFLFHIFQHNDVTVVNRIINEFEIFLKKRKIISSPTERPKLSHELPSAHVVTEVACCVLNC